MQIGRGYLLPIKTYVSTTTSYDRKVKYMNEIILFLYRCRWWICSAEIVKCQLGECLVWGFYNCTRNRKPFSGTGEKHETDDMCGDKVLVCVFMCVTYKIMKEKRSISTTTITTLYTSPSLSELFFLSFSLPFLHYFTVYLTTVFSCKSWFLAFHPTTMKI